MQLAGKKIVVMGLGVHGGGLGVARYCAENGAHVTVTDLRSAEILKPSIAALADLPITYVLGEHRASDFEQCDILVQNPAVPATSPYVAMARAAGAQIEMEMTLFFRACPAPVIGVTGAKGKTTTATLTAHLIRLWEPRTVLAGNMRISALAQLPLISADTPVVLELSSFVLEGLDAAHISPPIAAITNIHPDHLDRYGTMAAYIAAKAAIGRHQRPTDCIVLNALDPALVALAAEMPGLVIWSSTEALASVTEGSVWWHDDVLYTQQQAKTLRVASGDDVRLPGLHNRANVATAVALALRAGVPVAAIAPALQTFTGVEHRLEHLATFGGHAFVNDTAATMPDAAIAALRSLPQPIVWIAGGADKKLSYEQLASVAAQYAAAIVLLAGTGTPALTDALQRHGAAARIIGTYTEFEAAIRAAHAHPLTPATIALSPGCASFGMFNNEFHRGDEFRRIVSLLQHEEA